MHGERDAPFDLRGRLRRRRARAVRPGSERIIVPPVHAAADARGAAGHARRPAARGRCGASAAALDPRARRPLVGPPLGHRSMPSRCRESRRRHARGAHMARRPSSMDDGAAARALDHRVRSHHVRLAPSPRAPLDAHHPSNLPLVGANLVLVRMDCLRIHAGAHLSPRTSHRTRVAVARRRPQNIPRCLPAQVCIWRQIAQTGWVSTWLWTSALTIDWILLLLHKRATSRARHRHRIARPRASTLPPLRHRPPPCTGFHVSPTSRGHSPSYSHSPYSLRPPRSYTPTSPRTAS